ncbi:hypothetical protein L1987_85978 [Smallanthus sonchifolius]|uniref:Uncharacterized protein n=1 Tax=Smallanthus sonchifolius TaxID=185202 RepID=A0ACB8XYT7_9ASTR|nr:hypothetical protein L1987_85978 [Smallanthus sonchifolius]
MDETALRRYQIPTLINLHFYPGCPTAETYKSDRYAQIEKISNSYTNQSSCPTAETYKSDRYAQVITTYLGISKRLAKALFRGHIIAGKLNPDDDTIILGVQIADREGPTAETYKSDPYAQVITTYLGISKRLAKALLRGHIIAGKLNPDDDTIILGVQNADREISNSYTNQSSCPTAETYKSDRYAQVITTYLGISKRLAKALLRGHIIAGKLNPDDDTIILGVQNADREISNSYTNQSSCPTAETYKSDRYAQVITTYLGISKRLAKALLRGSSFGILAPSTMIQSSNSTRMD